MPRPAKQKRESFGVKLAELRARQRQEAQSAEVKLASQYVRDTRRALEEHINTKGSSKLQNLWNDWQEAQRIAGAPTKNAKPIGSGRLTQEDKEASGKSMLSILKGHKDGITARQLEDALTSAGARRLSVEQFKEVTGESYTIDGRGPGAKYKLK